MRISDWSSDVCSSDFVADWILERAGVSDDLEPGAQRELLKIACDAKEHLSDVDAVDVAYAGWSGELQRETFEIGRASWRGRVCQYVAISVVAVSLKKKEQRSMSQLAIKYKKIK